MSPQVPSPHSMIEWHSDSPGTAMRPTGHALGGSTGSQPYSPSCTNPDAHPSAGTPGLTHVPSASNSSAGSLHAGGGGTTAVVSSAPQAHNRTSVVAAMRAVTFPEYAWYKGRQYAIECRAGLLRVSWLRVGFTGGAGPAAGGPLSRGVPRRQRRGDFGWR